MKPRMTPELYRRVSEIVGSAAKLPAGEQAEFVEAACGGDDAEINDPIFADGFESADTSAW